MDDELIAKDKLHFLLLQLCILHGKVLCIGLCLFVSYFSHNLIQIFTFFSIKQISKYNHWIFPEMLVSADLIYLG